MASSNAIFISSENQSYDLEYRARFADVVVWLNLKSVTLSSKRPAEIRILKEGLGK